MRLVDASLPIGPGTVRWPGDPATVLHRLATVQGGDGANVSCLCMGTHTGTHVDAPVHLWATAGDTESFALDALVGPGRVVAVPGARLITAAHLVLGGTCMGDERVLIRTHNSERRILRNGVMATDYAALGPDAARLLVRYGVRLVGVDGLSVDPFAAGAGPAHHILLGAGIVIVEGLDLATAPAGQVNVWCLPLRLVGADGAPARVLLGYDGG